MAGRLRFHGPETGRVAVNVGRPSVGRSTVSWVNEKRFLGAKVRAGLLWGAQHRPTPPPPGFCTPVTDSGHVTLAFR